MNRYVVSRDGNGIEIVTKELISRKLLNLEPEPDPKTVTGRDGGDDAEVYTYVRREDNGSWVWHQEVEGNIIAGSRSTAPADASPWLVLLN